MATANFIAAAKEGTKEPTVLLSVESVNALEEVLTTQDDWEACTLGAGLDTTTTVGDVISREQLSLSIVPDSSTFSFVGAIAAESYDYHLSELTFTVGALPAGKSFRAAIIATNNILGSALFYSTNSVIGGNQEHSFSFGSTYTMLASTVYYFVVAQVDSDSARGIPTAVNNGHAALVTTSLTTTTIDLGVIPTEPSTLNIEDNVPAGSTLTFTAKGGNADPPTNSLGTVSDGSSLTAYRYYQVTATFGSTTGAQSSIQEIGISGGNSQFDYFGTHRDTPKAGTLPLLPPAPMSALNSKIDLKKISTTGEASIKLFWVDKTSDMMATGYLKNKAVKVQLGFLGLDSTDYASIFSGTWDDYTADSNTGTISVKLRDVLKQFEKVKIPEETFNVTTGAKETATKSWAESNIIQVMLEIIDFIGIPDRYIDRTAMNTLRDSVLTGNAWKVTRSITKPVDAWKLLSELSVLSGVFLVPHGDGVLTPVQYDDTAAAVATLDANICDFGAISGNTRNLYTRQTIYYDPNKTEPGDNADDYDKGIQNINAQAEIDWDETAENVYYDKWKLGYVSSAWTTTGQTNLTTRWDSWYANPRFLVRASNCPLWLIDVDPGQVVAVDGLKLPVPADEWDSGTTYTEGQSIVYSGRVYQALQSVNLNKNPVTETAWWEDKSLLSTGLTDSRKCLVMGKTVDPTQCIISFDLMELP